MIFTLFFFFFSIALLREPLHGVNVVFALFLLLSAIQQRLPVMEALTSEEGFFFSFFFLSFLPEVEEQILSPADKERENNEGCSSK